MTESDRKKAAKSFADYRKDRGNEKSDSQSFWLAFVREVLGVEEPEKFILFEERVKLDHTSFIDGHIPTTHVLIEQKKKGLNLRSPIKQSDGSLLTPFQQAQRYSAALPYSQHPRPRYRLQRRKPSSHEYGLYPPLRNPPGSVQHRLLLPDQ